ncbi:hypothetical protein SAMN02745136_03153 [Anaerocolumna jejuensis DSM 15929]|uniref:Uncharacterized protein n=1 Tax=Anaerocolumna jejuensis DSM 15929 TaxID=1121322 RepID=A0A1M6UM25_9FIRM|nr:hypothetical protein [Anaerocolumna jejuensis]SHK70262.1 hypothetical protein SAMN02745136_03153 [Anaerocolumna jejuensis DSM 15929]
MQLNDTLKMAMNVSDKFREKLGNKFDYSEISDVVDDSSHRAFKIRFTAYNYFIVLFNYDLDRIGCSLEYGEYHISLSNSQKWYSDADLDVFCNELMDELELRIPDKFLEAHGWK